MVVAINKMDHSTVNYSESRYYEIKAEISTHLKKVGFNANRIHFVPVSGLLGENLYEPSKLMTWYRSYSIVQALDALTEPKRMKDKPLRIPLMGSFSKRD